MVDGVALMMAQCHTPQMRLAPQGTNVFDSGCPYYDVYERADGRYMTVGATSPTL
jgi:alpha-methylacyl-CoA racemase